MSDIETDDVYDDSYDNVDERCRDCLCFDCVCDTHEGCDVCLMYGETQCSKHGPACIEAMREEDERQRIEDAVETILSLRASRDGAAWSRLVAAATQVKQEISGGDR